jgi:hypothetical protein
MKDQFKTILSEKESFSANPQNVAVEALFLREKKQSIAVVVLPR